mmetsp:Transcript_112762/g.224285  ORF Transcript_112762/g.224285 Transcript_112762/m.224285 type:complete len:208 (-) Transcript_112762:66-689(-)
MCISQRLSSVFVKTNVLCWYGIHLRIFVLHDVCAVVAPLPQNSTSPVSGTLWRPRLDGITHCQAAMSAICHHSPRAVKYFLGHHHWWSLLRQWGCKAGYCGSKPTRRPCGDKCPCNASLCQTVGGRGHQEAADCQPRKLQRVAHGAPQRVAGVSSPRGRHGLREFLIEKVDHAIYLALLTKPGTMFIGPTRTSEQLAEGTPPVAQSP